jgi:hypothetical protein
MIRISSPLPEQFGLKAPVLLMVKQDGLATEWAKGAINRMGLMRLSDGCARAGNEIIALIDARKYLNNSSCDYKSQARGIDTNDATAAYPW